MREKYGLSGNALKIIAAALMFLDHIHQFFGYTGAIPNIFTQLGRLSAPIFLFLIIEGFFKTKNRLKYFLKIYILAAGMMLVQYFIIALRLYINADSIPINGILSTFAVLLAALWGFELLKQRRFALGLIICAAVLILPYPAAALLQALDLNPFFNFLILAVFPLHTILPDGGTFILICGIALYIFKNNRALQAAAFIVAGNLYYYWQVYLYIGPITVSELFYPYCQWMMSFAVIFMLLYNGKRGGTKRTQGFFYIFYPLHIYVLYFTAFFLQRLK